MANPWVYEVFKFEDVLGTPVTIGVDYGCIALRANDVVLDAEKLAVLKGWLDVAVQQSELDAAELAELRE